MDGMAPDDNYQYRGRRTRPRCVACDRWLVPKDGRYVCWQCGEIHVLLDPKPNSPEFDNFGLATTGTKAFRPKTKLRNGRTVTSLTKAAAKKPTVTQGSLLDG